MKLFDQFKAIFEKKNSPSLAAKTTSKNSTQTQQQSTTSGRDSQVAGRDLIVNNNPNTPTALQKKDAAKSLIHHINAFFFSALGNSKIKGFLDERNFEVNGEIKESCRFQTEKAFEREQVKLEIDYKPLLMLFDEADQLSLDALLEPLTKIKFSSIKTITEELKEAILSNVKVILERYLSIKK